MSSTTMNRLVHRVLLTLAITCVAIPLPGISQEGSGSQGSAEQYENLAALLENQETREELIGELRSLAQGESGEAAQAAESAPSIPQRIADFTQNVAEGTVAELSSAASALRGLDLSAGGDDLTDLGLAALDLALVIAGTVLLLFALRGAAAPLFQKISTWARTPGTRAAQLSRRSLGVILAAGLDVIAVLLAWVGGYVVTLLFVGGTGVMEPRHSLFLNAFLMIEVVKAAIRMLFSARYEGLRLLPMPGEEAAYWNAWLARLIGIIGYGLLLVVPLVNASLGAGMGRVVGLTVMLVAFIYALTIILQNRLRVRRELQDLADRSAFAFTRFLLSMLAKFWHIAAIAYFGALAVVTITRPEDALPFMAQATAQTVIAALVGAFVAVVLSQFISRRIHLPDETRENFPLLEERLNSYIPTALKLMRLIILLIVLAMIADAWSLFNFGAWLVSEAGTSLIGTTVSVAVIVCLAVLFWIAVASWIEHRLNPQAGKEPGAREKTLLTIFRNAIAVALIVMTSMIVLSEIGINIGPLIAGAGVIGLAIGFGAQKLVQDIITGVFIQLENAINTGDLVTAAGITGTAEKLTIRSLGLRDLSGAFHIIPFSSVDSVTNYMREFAYHVGEYGVAYREDTDEVITHLRAAFDELRAHEEHGPKIISDLEVHGVTALADSAVNIRVRIKTLPGSQWAIGREYNRLVKRHFDAAGIEIPFPHMTLYFGEGKDGSAPPAHINLVEQPKPLQAPRKDETTSAPLEERAEANPEFKGDFDEPGDGSGDEADK